MKTSLPILLLLLAAPAFATAPAKPLPAAKNHATLGEIDAEAEEASTTLTVRLDKKPAWETPRDLQDHGTFLQLILPSVIVPEPGKFYEGQGPHVKKIAVFQLTPSDAGVRIFVEGNAAKIKAATSLELLDKRIVLSMDHARIPPPAKPLVATAPGKKQTAAAALAAKAAASDEAIAAAGVEAGAASAQADAAAEPSEAATQESAEAAGEELVEGAPPAEAAPALVGPPVPSAIRAKAETATADAVIAKTVVRNDPKPSELLKKDKGGFKAEGAGIDLRGKLIQVAMFLGGMLILMVLALAAKPWLRRRAAKAAGIEEQPLTMKTLATLPLAARQKVSVIQVGDEKILIGVTPENVTFLTALGKSAEQPLPARVAPSFSKLLEGGATKGEVELRPRPRIDGSRQLPAVDAEGEADATRARRSDAEAPRARAADGRQTRVDSDAPRARATTADLAPKRAKAPAGDFESALADDAPKAPARPRPAPSKINLAVGDDGVKDLGKPAPAKKAPGSKSAEAAGEGGQQAIDDVTKMIREKLRSLRSIS